MTRLKQLRNKRGLTQEYVANKLEMAISTLQKLEVGASDVNKVSAITVYKLAKFYDVSVGYLLGLEDR